MFEEPIQFNTIQEAESYYQDVKAYRDMCHNLYDTYLIKNLGLNTHIETRKTIKSYTHIFLTINPPPSMLLEDFHNRVNKTLAKNWIEGYIYVLEQRGENLEEIGKGFHTHILLKLRSHKRKSQIDREIKSTWKTTLDTDNYHILNIKYIDDDEQKRKQKYMLTLKSEEIKHKKQEYDIIWRENNNIKKYYFLDYIIETECLNQYQQDSVTVPALLQH